MRDSLLLFLLLFACHPQDAADRAALQSTGSVRGAEDAEWARVLDIAGRALPDGKRQLQTISTTTQFGRVRALAKTILSLWKDDEKTYEVAEPRVVERECIPLSKLKEVLGEKGEMLRLDVEVTVSPEGHAESVRVVTDTPRDDRLYAAIEESLMNARFVPRRVAGRYERGTVRLECKAHVR